MARTRPPALREGDLARAVSSLRDDLRNRYAPRGRAVLARRGLPAAAGHRGDDVPVLPGGPAQRRQARRRRRGPRPAVGRRGLGRRDRRRRRDGLRPGTPCTPRAAGTSGSACSASGPGWSAARSTSSSTPGARHDADAAAAAGGGAVGGVMPGTASRPRSGSASASDKTLRDRHDAGRDRRKPGGQAEHLTERDQVRAEVAVRRPGCPDLDIARDRRSVSAPKRSEVVRVTVPPSAV